MLRLSLIAMFVLAMSAFTLAAAVLPLPDEPTVLVAVRG